MIDIKSDTLFVQRPYRSEEFLDFGVFVSNFQGVCVGEGMKLKIVYFGN